ncbi:MAG: hypothetical protein HC772_01175 [Leptolyngbyaceae cyanobacterium CRU_2_3]|nr:hypothetical protein [Leptolyngbyaceae cyanobacterium CRU_2_3]
MKPQKTAYLLMGLGLTLLTACTHPLQTVSPSPSTEASTQPSIGTSLAQTGARPRPDTRVLPINIEGQLTEIELKLFDQVSLPLRLMYQLKTLPARSGRLKKEQGQDFITALKD